MTALLWFGQVRTSTVILGMFFVFRALVDRSWRPLVAGAAWLVGFEILYTATGAALGREHLTLTWLAWLGWPVAARAVGIRPHLALMATTAALWAAWVATGYHSNVHGAVALDPLAEALNEAAKTAWGLAYLVPGFALRPRRLRAAKGAPPPTVVPVVALGGR